MRHYYNKAKLNYISSSNIINLLVSAALLYVVFNKSYIVNFGASLCKNIGQNPSKTSKANFTTLRAF